MFKKSFCTLFAIMMVCSAAFCATTTINQTNEEEPNDTMGTANILGSSGTYTCGFSSSTDKDYFSFTTSVSGAVLTVEAIGSFATAVDTYLRILNSSEVVLAFNDDTTGVNAKISNLTLGSAGTYYIEVTEANQNSGMGMSYRLSGSITESSDVDNWNLY